jgi:TRAP transporter TAXI family solute receptor
VPDRTVHTAGPGALGRRGLLRFGAGLPLLALGLGSRTPAAAQDVKTIRIGSGPTGGTDFLFAGLVANAISNPPGTRECERGGNCGVPGLIAVAQTTQGATENLRAVARGDLDLGLTQADVASWTFAGTGAYAGESPLTNVRVIARLYPSTIHLVVRANAQIQSVTDLRGKKVGIGPEGSAAAATAKHLLSVFGVRWNQVQFRPLSFTAITDALATDAIDALFMIGGAPVLQLADLARRTPIRVVPLSGPIATKIAQVLPYYSLGVIPEGTYGTHPATPTLEVGTVLVARDTMDDELAFGIARAIWHERNEALFQNGHPSGKLMNKLGAALGVAVPLHPGAVRYYLAAGVPIPAENMPQAMTPARAPTPPSGRSS